MERITTTSMCYHMRYHRFYLSLAWFGGYLERVTARYHQIYKKGVYILILFTKLTVMRGNGFQIAPKSC